MTNGQDLDTLIDLDGVIIEQAGGCWTKFEALPCTIVMVNV